MARTKMILQILTKLHVIRVFYAFSPVQESVTPVEGAGVWLKSEAVRPLEVKV